MTDKDSVWRLLGENMRLVRQRAHRSLAQAAAEMGVSKGHLSMVEQGKARPSDELVQRYDTGYGADGFLASLYLLARTPRLAGKPWRPQPPASDRTEAPSVPRDGEAVAVDGDRSAFVGDVTLPDGSIAQVGQELSKTWRIRNAGSIPWTGRRLARIGPCDGWYVLASPPDVPIPDTGPGEHVDITVPLRAPTLPGTSFALWKMVHGDGRPVFPHLHDGLYALVIVVAVAASGATLTAQTGTVS
jgi:transcriptional regulator with XRE-family HTH domain